MDYTFSEITTQPEKLAQYAKFLSSVFNQSSKFSVDFLTWQYHNNPHGKAVGYDAYYNGELAAHYVTIPVLYRYHNQELKGLLSLNTATHPSYQGKGLFTQLANKTYELGKAKGYDFVIGVANQNSTHGFVKKLGFTLIAPLEVKTGMGKVVLPKTAPFQSVWDDTSLAWRLANPQITYTQKNNYAIAPTEQGFISAQLYQSDIPLALAKKSKPFKLWIGIADTKQTKGLFVNLPDRFKPSPLNLIFKSLNPAIAIPSKDIIRFELIDFDAY